LIEKIFNFRGGHFTVIVVVEVTVNAPFIAPIRQIQLHAQRNVQFERLVGHFRD
jgi:hypothetical protein